MQKSLQEALKIRRVMSRRGTKNWKLDAQNFSKSRFS